MHGRISKSVLMLLAGVLFVAAVLVIAIFALTSREQDGQRESRDTSSVQEPPAEEQKPPLVDLQPVVDQWLAGQSAEYSIVVYDPANEQTIASHRPDEQYFAASLYKLFVAYLALQDFQAGIQNPDEALIQGFTRKECVDKMIRDSDSPCGEAMMASIGPANLQTRLSAMGINGTTFPGITTTAADNALILRKILEGQDLNKGNTVLLRDAMRVQDQQYRNGLAKGAPEAVWETKVGWHLDQNYHDVGMMLLPGGREYIVATLSQNNGASAPIADFAATIYAALAKE